jgi:hypothetical protein
MLRFIWKERFDDRTWWACLLSLVSKGIVVLEDEDGKTFVQPTKPLPQNLELPREERLLTEALFHSRTCRRVALDIADAKTAIAISTISQYLHTSAVGKWFRPSRQCLLYGAGLSLASICVAAGPQTPEQWGGLILAVAAMAPGGYYLFFLGMRIFDLFRAAREHLGVAVLASAAPLFGLVIPCIAALALGSLVLGVNFGSTALAVTGFLVAVNVAVLLQMRLPTAEGTQLLTEIEGFRDFLNSVERLPMDRLDAPDKEVGLYEKYLPYAVALEVEQSWSDQFVALKSAFQEGETSPGVRPFYLGMWDGKPVEIVFRKS